MRNETILKWIKQNPARNIAVNAESGPIELAGFGRNNAHKTESTMKDRGERISNAS